MSESTYRIDPTHTGIRFTVLAAFVIGFSIALIWGQSLLNLRSIDPLLRVLTIGTLSFSAAIVIGWGAEKYLIAHWPSGRTMHITEAGITLAGKSGNEAAIAWESHINIMRWKFVVRQGHPWVPKGWYCVACQIKQDDTTIIPYTFIKPTSIDVIPDSAKFEELLTRKGAKAKNIEQSLGEIGGLAQLRYAERDRWLLGVEMLPTDFADFVSELNKHTS